MPARRPKARKKVKKAKASKTIRRTKRTIAKRKTKRVKSAKKTRRPLAKRTAKKPKATKRRRPMRVTKPASVTMATAVPSAATPPARRSPGVGDHIRVARSGEFSAFPQSGTGDAKTVTLNTGSEFVVDEVTGWDLLATAVNAAELGLDGYQVLLGERDWEFSAPA